MNSITAHALKPLLTAEDEIALLDVREYGQYGEGHPFFSVPFPYSRLEARAPLLLPRKDVHLVLLDDGDGVAARAASQFESLGYQNVSISEGGAPAWVAAGYTLYKGVNVQSKTYGELLEHVAETPSVTASELSALLERDPSVVVLDGRSPEEYQNMSLPGALCCPNAELGFRIQSLVPDEATTIVINCAGRTRSILGVEGLRVLNIKNPIFALENGTQGWRLAGLDLDHGVLPQALPEPDDHQFARMTASAQALIAAGQLKLIAPTMVADWLNNKDRTTYLLDVRTKSEFEKSHWPNSRHAPGGQLVQATDQYVAVRNARIVLSDDNQLRAATTAIRLQDMGHDVYLLDADARAGTSDASGFQKIGVNTIQFEALPQANHARCLKILDASPGMQFREAHIDGAVWVTRARLDRLALAPDEDVLVTGHDAALIEGIVIELNVFGFTNVRCSKGSLAIWMNAGYTVISTPDEPSDDECIDYLFFVHDRHDGNMDAARRYLAWEVGLIDQLDAQERSVLNPRTQFMSE